MKKYIWHSILIAIILILSITLICGCADQNKADTGIEPTLPDDADMALYSLEDFER